MNIFCVEVHKCQYAGLYQARILLLESLAIPRCSVTCYMHERIVLDGEGRKKKH